MRSHHHCPRLPARLDEPITATVKVWIYRGSRRAETYLYLPEQDNFAAVPQGLLDAMGKLELVMELELHESRTLARAKVEEVMANVLERGFYLQMPPVETERPKRPM